MVGQFHARMPLQGKLIAIAATCLVLDAAFAWLFNPACACAVLLPWLLSVCLFKAQTLPQTASATAASRIPSKTAVRGWF
jgi:hypothetical protein